MVNWKEIAKFASGMAAFNVLGHIFLALGGFLPMPWFGFTLTQMNNTIIIVVSAVVSSALAYYAWIKK